MPIKKILAIETSTPHGHIALLDDGKIVSEGRFESQRSHNAQMFGPAKEALEAAGKSLDLIVVGTGPGSYTGVRIGIAAAQGFAWSRNARVIGLPSVLAVESDEYVVCGDARRGMYFAAEVRQGQLKSRSITLTLAELHDKQASSQTIPWFSFDDKVPADLTSVILIKPNVVTLAHRAARLTNEEVTGLEQEALEPFYLSAPFVTQSKKVFGVA